MSADLGYNCLLPVFGGVALQHIHRDKLTQHLPVQEEEEDKENKRHPLFIYLFIIYLLFIYLLFIYLLLLFIYFAKRKD